jgi:hypothetical protein
MNSRITLLIAAPLLLAATQAFAQRDTRTGSTAEVALSNDTLQLRYLGNGSAVGVQGSRFAGGVFLGEERDFVMNAGLLFPADLGIRRLNISFGPQVYAALLQEENDDVMAVSIGTEVRFFLDPARGLAVSGQAYYAPDILTFGSADNLTDGSGKRTLQQEAFVGVGYRF